ncbi:MAG: hypothetical protein WA708_13855 [Acidobacteriaceae bacterium]
MVSRYEFTDSNGYGLGTITAETATEARTKAIARWGSRVARCSHLSDDHSGEGADAIFFLGPDGIE